MSYTHGALPQTRERKSQSKNNQIIRQERALTTMTHGNRSPHKSTTQQTKNQHRSKKCRKYFDRVSAARAKATHKRRLQKPTRIITNFNPHYNFPAPSRNIVFTIFFCDFGFKGDPGEDPHGPTNIFLDYFSPCFLWGPLGGPGSATHFQDHQHDFEIDPPWVPKRFPKACMNPITPGIHRPIGRST